MMLAAEAKKEQEEEGEGEKEKERDGLSMRGLQSSNGGCIAISMRSAASPVDAITRRLILNH